jgi:ribosomal 50S subunit-recycling heat shock protein
VEIGQEITVQLGMSRKKYRILQLPNRPVAKAARTEYAELMSSEGI